jgi:hypothetical protein
MDVPWKFGHPQPRSERLSQDELEHVAVGDPDPTAQLGMANRYRRCRFEWTDTTAQTLILRWSCTRELGHQGQHVAGTGEWVAAVQDSKDHEDGAEAGEDHGQNGAVRA